MTPLSQLEPHKHPNEVPALPTQEGQERLPSLALWGFLIVVLVVVAALGVWSLLAQQPMTHLMRGQGAPTLPVYGVVPDFTLIERSGQPVRLEDLSGKVWIASFIFTHCPDECPVMTAELARAATAAPVSSQACPGCGLGAHEHDAVYCRKCGTKL